MDDPAPYFLDSLVVGDLQMNCYLFGCSATRQTAIIDPGGDAELIVDAVTGREANVRMIILTHGHYDHLGAVTEIKKRYNCPILIHHADEETLTNPMVNLSALTGESIVCPPADQILEEGDMIKIGNVSLEVFHTPGHSRGSVCLRYDGIVFGGDVLFNGSIGRTDLPGGSFEELERSIKTKLYTLPDETIIYPGHGETTSVGYEKRTNPFVRGI